MDTLSLISEVTKNREKYFSLAQKLARRSKTLEKLESLMYRDSNLLSTSLSQGEIRSQEFFRSLIDKTLTSALASVILGSKSFTQTDSERTFEKAWPIIVGQMLPPLTQFINEIQQGLDNGDLKVEDQSDYEDFSRKMSWLGMAARVLRYIANPSYSFFSLGEYFEKERQGFKMMRRVPRVDDRTCSDCIEFGNMGWQPIGTLPMPGQQCRCYDRCRCRIEYR
jgi:hypothetical protein